VRECIQNLILLVEDDQSIRSDLSELLRMEGYEVDVAENGAAAVRLLEKASQNPSLIILDIMMPVMDGWEFREAQLKMEEASSIPVIVMTADGSAAEKASKMNVQGYIQKPIHSINALLKTIQQFSNPNLKPI
jgi:CheY-like chemotaxis protein